MPENDKKENKFKEFFKKVGSTILGWLKSGFKWIAVGIVAAVSIILFKKVDHIVQVKDEKKKQKAKDDVNEVKDKLDESKETTEEIKSDVESIKEEVETEKKELEDSKKEYSEKQKEIAEEAGFVKDK